MPRTEITQAPGSTAGGVEVRCTLPLDQLASRLAEIRKDILPHVRKTDRLEDGYVLELSKAPELRARIERIITLEQECCEGLRFDLSEVPQAGGLRLEIHGIDPRARTLEQLLGGPKSGLGAPLPGTFMRRVLSSVGIGFAGAFVLGCVLPIVLAGLIGATAAAFLAKFDSLPALAAAAVVFGGAAWLFQRQRSTLKDEGRLPR